VTKLYARLITVVIKCARRAPLSWSSALEDLALKLTSLSRHLPPMPRAALALGVPFIGIGVCEDIDCRATWTVFSPVGGDEDLVLVCDMCGQDTGVIA